MRFTAFVLSRAAAGITLGLSLALSAAAETPFGPVADTVARIEDQFGGRVGITLIDTGSDMAWSHRPDERFLMNSTVKVPVCAAVLAGQDAGTLSLSDQLVVGAGDILDYAPVTQARVGEAMSVADLCFATIDMSDNTAANLLIAHLGGPDDVTQFLRNIGDPVSRLDRYEPTLNSFAPGDPRDTTTPVAMAMTLHRLLLGDVLSPSSRVQLAEWMRPGGVTGALLRDKAPQDWVILDKSGSGEQTRNLVAVVTPDGQAPWIVTIFISDVDADFATRNAALQELSGAVIAAIGE